MTDLTHRGRALHDGEMGGNHGSTETLNNAPETSGTALLIYHKGSVKVVPMVVDVPLVVGRTWPADVVVNDPSLSRKHLRVCYTNKGVVVDDLDSTNGTQVAGQRIDHVVLAPGDPFFAGGVTLSVNVAWGQHRSLAGVDSHERFLLRLSDDTVRSRAFRRPFSLLMLRSGGLESHLTQWLPRVRAELRSVDRIGPYGPHSALVLLAEADRETGSRLASQLLTPRFGEPRLYGGLATFPEASSTDELIEHARTACRRATAEEPLSLAGGVPGADDTQPIVLSQGMRALYATLDKVAPANLPVLVHGETGSGKEMVAQAIHQRSSRKERPIRSINCGALVATLLESELFGHEKGAFTGADSQRAGVFEQADGGTVFLDEIGELSPASQAALLRVIETKRMTRVGGTDELEVDVRVVAATHRNLEEMVERGEFRQDLLFRLNAVTLSVPPLRERTDEVEPLAERFLADAIRHGGVSPRVLDPEAVALLQRYHWPGNVRELRNVIERAVLVAAESVIGVHDLPSQLRHHKEAPESGPLTGPRAVLEDGDVEFKERVRAYEVELILDALKRANGNQTLAAKLLRMPLRTMVHKIKAYGIRKNYQLDE